MIVGWCCESVNCCSCGERRLYVSGVTTVTLLQVGQAVRLIHCCKFMSTFSDTTVRVKVIHRYIVTELLIHCYFFNKLYSRTSRLVIRSLPNVFGMNFIPWHWEGRRISHLGRVRGCGLGRESLWGSGGDTVPRLIGRRSRHARGGSQSVGFSHGTRE